MLNEYKKKRNFKLTTEPAPGRRTGVGELAFVVQKHSARRLHYDFRIELDGVLKSWALPNGPSLDPKTKRLAVMVEDHPIDYASFEGVIPEGEYGGGQVIVWDRGTYIPIEDGKGPITDRTQAEAFLRNGLEKGKISLLLEGSKLKGSWALVKMQRLKKDWLLIKHQDEFANHDGDIQKEDTSVISGLTIEDLKKKQEPIKSSKVTPEQLSGIPDSPFPSSLSPMLATLIKSPFSNPDWFFEPKLDGYRLITFVRDGKVKLLSRRGLDVTVNYPFVAGSLAKQAEKDMILDGELVALDENGHTCFQCLQNHANSRPAFNSKGEPTQALIVYYVFDILYLRGKDLRGSDLVQRKKLLNEVLILDNNVRLVEYFENDGQALYEVSIDQGLEGIIAKKKDSTYETGMRSKSWLKIKATQTEEFVIVGYTQGTGNRADTLGALILGSYNDHNKLVFAGNVGSGFDYDTLQQLRKKLDTLKRKSMPLPEKPPLNGEPTWVRAELVAEVRFAERTQDGFLRAPVFLRLRDDKAPSEVRFIEAKDAPVVDSPGEQRFSSHEGMVDRLLSELNVKDEKLIIEVEGNRISLTNLDKPIWPASENQSALTKRNLIQYLIKVSPYMLPHLKDRPLTLTRFPHGISGQHFYQKHSEDSPEFVKTVPLREHSSEYQNYMICNNLSTLIWLGQLANVDIHTWFSRITPELSLANSKNPDENGPDYFSHYPDFIIFDIDPYIYSGNEARGAEPELNRKAFEQTGQAALWLKEALTALSLNSFVKTSGRTGLHIFVPVVREFDFSAVHSASKTISTFVFQNHPNEITLDWAVAKRTGKIFLDYNQNVRGKTLASIYSPRPSPQATVSTPLNWKEIGKIYPTDFTISTVPQRLAKIGDLWSDILDQKKDLTQILKVHG